MEWAFGLHLPPAMAGHARKILPPDVLAVWPQLTSSQKRTWKVSMWHEHRGTKGGSCLLDETFACEVLVSAGLANAELLVESRCASRSFSLFERRPSGFSTSREVRKMLNVFFYIVDQHQYLQ